MTLPSDRLQLLFERHLELLVKFRTQLLNQSRYEDATEVDGLISEFHSELENDSLHESSMNCTSNETVVHDAPGGPVLSIPETCPVMESNSIIPETACTDSSISSSRNDPLVLPENVSHASNNGQKSNTILIDAVYFGNVLSTNGISKRSDGNVSQESNSNDLISIVADPQHLVSSSGLSTQCGKYALNRVTLTVTWVYEDPTLFRGGG
ncbi:unnamed protein product [Schistosoma margrebowiei]|uniref:Uncharacterized protein n=1 Tax=Schistosoma margrebowiei TaxID=48269 RepID=A0AA85AQF9_9TREM|nr:unnamed protein product [Schistosoma margrebowiei]